MIEAKFISLHTTEEDLRSINNLIEFVKEQKSFGTNAARLKVLLSYIKRPNYTKVVNFVGSIRHSRNETLRNFECFN